MPERCKVLIVDDDDGDRVLMQQAIENAKFDVEIHTAATGEEGVKKSVDLKNQLVVILDTNLPGIDGFETCKQIKTVKEMDPQVIICTGVIDAVDAAKALEVGADDYCVKTSDFENLLEVLSEKITAAS